MKFKPGDMVRFVNPKADGVDRIPFIGIYYPKVDELGRVAETIESNPRNENLGEDNLLVKWNALSVPYYVSINCVEHVEEHIFGLDHVADREWEDANIRAFLNAKFAKNPNMTFNEMIVLAYRSGYLRAKKGRPMVKNMGAGSSNAEKNNVGHWEPVDPNNLPKVGSKVRYVREINWWDGFPRYPEGQTGIVTVNDRLAFGITWDDHSVIGGRYKTVYSYEHPDRFDVWVDAK